MSKCLESIKKIQWKLEDEDILGEEYELCDFLRKEIKEKEKKEKALDISKEIDKTSLLHFIAVCVKDQKKYDFLKEVIL